MSTLSDNEDYRKETLNTIKRELKCWESMFERKHGRRPNKDDIKQTSQEIRETYQKYAELKKILSCSVQGTQREEKKESPVQDDRENSDGVFGSWLNKSKNNDPWKRKIKLKSSEVDISRCSKVTPSKFKLKRSALSSAKGSSEFTDCVGGNKEEKEDSVSSSNHSPERHKDTPTSKIPNTVANSDEQNGEVPKECALPAFNIVKPVIKCSFAKPRSRNSFANHRTLSVEWLAKLDPSKGKDRNSVEEKENDDFHRNVLDSHLDKNTFPSQNVIDLPTHCTKTFDSKVSESTPLDHTLGSLNGEEVASKDGYSFKTTVMTQNEGRGMCTDNASCNTLPTDEEIITLKSKKPSSGDRKKNERKGERKRKCKDQGNVRAKRQKTSPTLEVQVSETEVTKSTENECTSASQTKKTNEKKQKRSTAKKGSNLVSENFVKLDLKKKIYLRGASNSVAKGGRYKRKQWQQKSQFAQGRRRSNLAAGRSSSTCFKCGKDGHWAKDCRGFARKQVKTDNDFESMPEDSSYDPSVFTCEGDEVDVLSSSSAIKAIDDIPDVLPCWPRIPFQKLEIPPAVQPLFPSQDGKPSTDAYKAVKQTLQDFGYSNFRDGQEETTARIVSGLSTLLVLSTGSGKSLCYQIPAYLYHKMADAMTLVISPLVALMEDQISGLPYGLKGACLHTNMTKPQRNKVMRDVANGNIAVLLVSPEAITSNGRSIGFLSGLSQVPRIAFVCIDEAHCVSEWSHNFRPSYLRVCKILRERLGVNCMLGLTATATEATSASIASHLGMSWQSESRGIIRGHVLPDNLVVTVSRDPDREQALVSLLSSAQFEEFDSIIIYCTRRDQTERVANVLNNYMKEGMSSFSTKGSLNTNGQRYSKYGKKSRSLSEMKESVAEPYHAGLSPVARRRIQKLFMTGQLRVVVATVAFGMGLDKSDVRAIIHYNMPKSFENFVQEIGRAGRDGKPAFCHIFLDEKGADMSELRRHAFSSSMDEFTVKEFVNTVFPSCECQELWKKHGCGPIPDTDNKFSDHMSSQTVREKEVKSLDTDVTELCEQLAFDDSFDGSLPNSDNVTSVLTTNKPLPKICYGHHVALPVSDIVEKLDLQEENILTLLTYLELHDDNLIEYCGTIRSSCSVKFYGGPSQFAFVASKFQPLRVALTLMKRKKDKLLYYNSINFNCIELADFMCWDVDPLLRELRSLQWNTHFSINSQGTTVGKSGILSEFDNPCFHIINTGLDSGGDKDSICTFLNEIVKSQERQRLLQIDALYSTLRDISHLYHYECANDMTEVNKRIRERVNDYFQCDSESVETYLKGLSTFRFYGTNISESKWGTISRDIQNLVNTNSDINFTGRAIARIFHGIESPRFPAITWGRNRAFWRRYLDIEFNTLRKFSTEELVRFRK